MYSVTEYALVKSDGYPSGYRIVRKDADQFIIIEDTDHAINAVKQLLADGAEIFETESEFRTQYPLPELSFEERRFQALAYWEENAAEHLWPDDIRRLIEQKRANTNN